MFLTEVPDMAKRSEAASVQVCLIRMATSGKMLVFVFPLMEHHWIAVV